MSPFVYRLAHDVPLMTEGAIIALLHPVDLAENQRIRAMRAEHRPQVTVDDRGIATIGISGALMRNPTPWELFIGRAEDTDQLRETINAAASDSNIRAIVLAIDSPGGMFNGGPELAEAVRTARDRKPIVSYISGMAASLAYMIAAETSVVVASPSAMVGSIGAIATHIDMTGLLESVGIKVNIFRSVGADLKAPGIYGTALTDAQRESFQSTVDKVGAIFQSRVMRARPRAKIEGLRGRMFLGDDAADLGLIDWAGDSALAKALTRVR